MSVLNDATRANIERALATFPEKHSAYLPALKAAQQQCGHLGRDVLCEVAEVLGADPNALYMLATFYDMLYLEPVGRHVLAMCNNIPCWLAGADELIAQVGARLGVDIGDTTPDGLFTLKTAECLGACDKAPAMLVDESHCESLTPERLDRLIGELRQAAEGGHASV